MQGPIGVPAHTMLHARIRLVPARRGARYGDTRPLGEAGLADARATARALPSYRVILVFLAIDLTSLVLEKSAGSWELRALSRSA